MPPLDEEVGGDRELHALAHPDARAVVAHALYRPRSGAGEKTADDLEFVQAGMGIA
jgi:hypothetical protein